MNLYIIRNDIIGICKLSSSSSNVRLYYSKSQNSYDFTYAKEMSRLCLTIISLPSIPNALFFSLLQLSMRESTVNQDLISIISESPLSANPFFGMRTIHYLTPLCIL